MSINWTVGRDPLEPIVFDWIWIGLRLSIFVREQWREGIEHEVWVGRTSELCVGAGGGNNKTVDTPQSVRRVTFGGVENPCDFFSPEV